MSRVVLFAMGLGLLGGCEGISADQGLDALMRIPGAQFYRGMLPEAMDGPAISSFANANVIIRPGQQGAPLSGIVPRETTAIAVYLEGDVGYWIVTPGAADASALDQLTFGARLSFSPLLPEGAYTVAGRASNAAGQFGPPSRNALTTAEVPSGNTLLVSLRWDTEADLDLHLVIPDGTEIWANKINSYTPPPPGTPTDPDAYKSGGILDVDSNSACAIDGRRLENIYWTQTPPSGHYVARVDIYSLCGVPQADWRLDVTLMDASLGIAGGTGRDSDAALTHGKGAGVTALEFDIP
jgi:hypothetical protein